MSIMEAALTLNRAAEITGDKTYRIAAQRQLDWVMGCNPFDASAIEGVGYNQPLRGLCNGLSVSAMSFNSLIPERSSAL